MNNFRIFILGAGFSVAAGLPLADSLWQEVMKRVQHEGWLQEELEFQLSEYDRFRISRGDSPRSTIDFEDFLAFLDFEHALGLKGSDHFSNEGNRLQLVLKWLIAQVLVERTPHPSRLPRCYLDFAECLQPNDLVITFNYDTVLEDALERVGKPFRLFPSRYSEIKKTSGVIDSSKKEIVVLKLHGSVDWFDRASYTSQERHFSEAGLSEPPDNLVFGPNSQVTTTPLLEGPQFPDDPLLSVYRVTEKLDWLYLHDPPILVSPVLLAPSNMKVLYAQRLKYFFWGLGKTGGWNLGLIVIGYSLPRHDDYARRFLMHMFRNYQGFFWDEEFVGRKKKPALLIDYRDSLESRKSYKVAYSFSEEAKTRYYFDGFDERAVSVIRDAT
jgi:hypothetical protein